MDPFDVAIDAPACPLLTIEEAARVLRIGRSLAYQLANEYLATGGTSGMPVIRLGGCLRAGTAVGVARARPGRPRRPPL